MNNTVLAILLLAVGLGIGLLLGWLLARRRTGDTPAADMAALLAPAAATLDRVERQLHEVERDRLSAYSGLREQVAALHHATGDLGAQTRALSGALRAPNVRGRWGEIQLQRIVELAGMVEHCDFDTQVSRPGPDQGVRPDMIVRLSGGRQVPLDAKVPLAAYLDALDTPDERRRRELLAAHGRAMRSHVDALAAKSYWQHFSPAPEFVIMFVPSEPLLDAALAADPGLAEHAFSRNVVIATPTTLIALLRTIAYSWRTEQLSASAEEVRRLGAELYARLATAAGHLSRLGASLNKAVESYNSAIRSVESRVLVTARKLADTGVSADPLPGPEQIETTARRLQAPEFERANDVLPLPGRVSQIP